MLIVEHDTRDCSIVSNNIIGSTRTATFEQYHLLQYIASRHDALMALCSTSSINFVVGISSALEPDSLLCTTHCYQPS